MRTSMAASHFLCFVSRAPTGTHRTSVSNRDFKLRKSRRVLAELRSDDLRRKLSDVSLTDRYAVDKRKNNNEELRQRRRRARAASPCCWHPLMAPQGRYPFSAFGKKKPRPSSHRGSWVSTFKYIENCCLEQSTSVL